jgi:hypothetical protein
VCSKNVSLYGPGDSSTICRPVCKGLGLPGSPVCGVNGVSGASASVEINWANACGSRRTRISRNASANWPETIRRFSSA